MAKLSLDDAVEIAKSYQGMCLFKEYINNRTLLKLRIYDQC